MLPYRPPLATAKWIATIQELSGNRLLLGVGAGWMQAEFRAVGVDPRQRGKLTDATLAFLRRCFAADEVEANGQPFLFLPRRLGEETDRTGSPRIDAPHAGQGTGPPLWRRFSWRATERVMVRLNLTLDRDTYAELESHAKRQGKARARVAKELLAEGLARQALRERRQRLARDYAAGRSDAGALLRDHESAQFDLLDDEDA